jgi:hypothetical protein
MGKAFCGSVNGVPQRRLGTGVAVQRVGVRGDPGVDAASKRARRLSGLATGR